MNPGAGVTSLAALNEWYGSLASFRVEAQNALTSLALSLQRAEGWLNEQHQYWHRQIRVCEEKVAQAKAELRTRQMANFSGERPDCSAQEKALRQAKARLEFAEERLDAVRGWMKRLPVEIRDVYDAPVRRLSNFLDADLARGLAVLTRQLTALEQYTNLRSEVAPASVAPVADPPKGEPS
jgi:hypothetical protein